jgi:hypothetical protein
LHSLSRWILHSLSRRHNRSWSPTLHCNWIPSCLSPVHLRGHRNRTSLLHIPNQLFQLLLQQCSLLVRCCQLFPQSFFRLCCVPDYLRFFLKQTLFMRLGQL